MCQWRILMVIVYLCILACKMFSSTIDYRWRVRRFPTVQRFQVQRFQPFRLFHYSFQDNSNSVSLRFGLLVSCLSRNGEDSSLVDGLVEMSEWGHAYIKQFGVACSAIRSTNHCYQSIARISIILHAQNCLVALWEGDMSLSKVYEGLLGYVEGSPLTLCNHFIQHYRALDTRFSKYY